MGMFDSLIASDGGDWQTKAFHCDLDRYEIGDVMPDADAEPPYQVKVLGGEVGEFIDSYAAVRNSRLAAVPDARDATLPLLDYHGGVIPATEGI